MKAYVTYTILDTVEVKDFCGTSQDFMDSVYEDSAAVADEIFKAIGLRPNDIEVDFMGE